MDSTASKTISQDRASTYKGRGKLGSSNRFVRAHQASVDRKASRMDNLTTRRRIPLSPITDKNQPTEETEDGNTKAAPSVDPRREKLLKWREQQMLKKKVQQAQRARRKSFVVRQIKHSQGPFLMMDKIAKVAKKPAVLAKPEDFQQNPEKRVTRASAQLATATTGQDRGKTVNKANTRKGPADQCNVTNKTNKAKVVEKKEAVKDTKKSTAPKPKSSAAKTDLKQRTQMKTRSQLKKEKLQETKTNSSGESESESGEPKEQEDKREAIETLSFPQLEAIKNTVSVGRGSTEGVERGAAEMEGQSFAPHNFQFRAPSGVGSFFNASKSFKFQPLSPGSAERFMFSSFFSPVQPASENQLAQQDCANAGSGNSDREVFMEAVSQSIDGAHVILGSQQNSEVSTEDPGAVEDTKTGQADIDRVSKSETKPEEMETTEEKDDHDVTHFRNLIKSETERLNKACENWEKITAEEQELSEEVNGQIRTVIGQAQLLIAQRFHQFSGLIDLSQDKTAEKQATASDLQGFWEMIYFQVEDVNAKFEALSKLQQNGWKEETKVVTKGRKKPKDKKPKVGTTSKENTNLSGTRSRIQEMRAKMKAQKSKLENRNENTIGDAFVTILTPVTKRTKFDNSGEIRLTPVRRSIRKTPLKRDVHLYSPAIVTTLRKSTKHSPALKLTPDTSTKNDLSTAQERDKTQETQVTQSEESKETAEESDLVSSESNTDVEMKTSCDDKSKSAKGKRRSRKMNPRKSSGRVTFQPHTPITSTLSPALSALVQTSGAEKRTPRTPSNRRLSRKCRVRVPTPYFSGREERRVSGETTVTMEIQEEPAPQTADSTTESDEPKSREENPPRRSARKTPKLRKRATSIDEKSGILMYLCPSTSDEDMPAANPRTLDFQEEGRKETAPDDLEKSPNESNTCFQSNLFNPLTSGLRLKGTPMSILQHINDLETPSPNSRQITPMPKTTLYISPPGGENVAKPAPLLPLTPVVGFTTVQVTPSTQLARLTLAGTPLNLIDKRRDSVFFAPSSESFKLAQENLMCFSPAVAAAKSATNKHV